MEDLYGKLADILEVDRVGPADVLRAFESWDSLAVLSILAVLDSDYGINLTAAELNRMPTAGDLAGLVRARSTS